jgi:hypothetical protein
VTLDSEEAQRWRHAEDAEVVPLCVGASPELKRVAKDFLDAVEAWWDGRGSKPHVTGDRLRAALDAPPVAAPPGEGLVQTFAKGEATP